MSERLRKRIESVLSERLSGLHANWRHSEKYPFYCASPELNLLEGIELQNFEQDFRKGAGGELEPDGATPPKFSALISSSALVANCFGPFRHNPSSLPIGGLSGFDELRFEAQCPTGLGGTPPTLDVLFAAKDRVLAIESKFSEYFTTKPAKFSKAYDQLLKTSFEPSWASIFSELKRDSLSYTPLDAAQLVKHYLGLRNTFPGQELSLLYLYWESSNAEEHEISIRHREAANRFANRTKESTVRFEHMSYADLWREWAASSDKFLVSHTAALLARYSIRL